MTHNEDRYHAVPVVSVEWTVYVNVGVGMWEPLRTMSGFAVRFNADTPEDAECTGQLLNGRQWRLSGRQTIIITGPMLQ